MRTKIFISKILACICLFACASKNPKIEPSNVKDALLQNCWIHSYEEKAGDGEEIFRLCDSKEFPPSRFRRKMDLKENHQADFLVLSPTDRHFTSNGTWTYNSEKQILLLQETSQNITLELQVISIEADKMVVKFLN